MHSPLDKTKKVCCCGSTNINHKTPINKIRQAGLYWITLDGCLTIAENNGEAFYPWHLIGSDNVFDDYDIDEIHEQVKQPNKNWRTQQ